MATHARWIILLLSLIAVASGNICPVLNVGSSPNSPSTMTDIISKGQPQKQWEKQTNPRVPNKLILSTQKLEYFYIINLNFPLDSSDIVIQNDDRFFANHTHKLTNVNQSYYTVMMDYNCQDYGGAIIRVHPMPLLSFSHDSSCSVV